jgi:hypothetical protein
LRQMGAWVGEGADGQPDLDGLSDQAYAVVSKLIKLPDAQFLRLLVDDIAQAAQRAERFLVRARAAGFDVAKVGRTSAPRHSGPYFILIWQTKKLNIDGESIQLSDPEAFVMRGLIQNPDHVNWDDLRAREDVKARSAFARVVAKLRERGLPYTRSDLIRSRSGRGGGLTFLGSGVVT